MERRFVDNNNTLTATQVRRAAGERNNTKAGVRKFDGVSLDVFVVVVLFPESFFNFTGRIVECPCPHRTRLNVFDGHVLVISDVIHIHPACWRRRGGGQYVIGCLSPCNTGTTALFYHLKRRGVSPPSAAGKATEREGHPAPRYQAKREQGYSSRPWDSSLRGRRQRRLKSLRMILSCGNPQNLATKRLYCVA